MLAEAAFKSNGIRRIQIIQCLLICALKQKWDENLVDSTGVNNPLEEKKKD